METVDGYRAEWDGAGVSNRVRNAFARWCWRAKGGGSPSIAAMLAMTEEELGAVSGLGVKGLAELRAVRLAYANRQRGLGLGVGEAYGDGGKITEPIDDPCRHIDYLE